MVEMTFLHRHLNAAPSCSIKLIVSTRSYSLWAARLLLHIITRSLSISGVLGSASYSQNEVFEIAKLLTGVAHWLTGIERD